MRTNKPQTPIFEFFASLTKLHVHALSFPQIHDDIDAQLGEEADDNTFNMFLEERLRVESYVLKGELRRLLDVGFPIEKFQARIISAYPQIRFSPVVVESLAGTIADKGDTTLRERIAVISETYDECITGYEETFSFLERGGFPDAESFDAAVEGSEQLFEAFADVATNYPKLFTDDERVLIKEGFGRDFEDPALGHTDL